MWRSNDDLLLCTGARNDSPPHVFHVHAPPRRRSSDSVWTLTRRRRPRQRVLRKYYNMEEVQAARALRNGTVSHASAPLELRLFDLELSVRPRLHQWALVGVIKMTAPIKEVLYQLDFEGTIFCRRPPGEQSRKPDTPDPVCVPSA